MPVQEIKGLNINLYIFIFRNSNCLAYYLRDEKNELQSHPLNLKEVSYCSTVF